MSNKVSLDIRVEKAIDLLYRTQSDKKIKRAMEILHEAKDDGDADAWYFLARCYYGSNYGYRYSGIEENNELGNCYLFESIERGSAFGVIGGLRLPGVSSEHIKELMTFDSFAQARDIIMELALNGDGFSQYMIANTYYWQDIYLIDNLPYNKEKEKKLKLECVKWYEKAMSNGIFLGYANYANLYVTKESGIEEDLVAYEDVLKRSAEAEWLAAKHQYGLFLERNGRFKEAVKYFRQAAMRGYSVSWSYLGDAIIKEKESSNSKVDMEIVLRCYRNGEKEEDDRSIYKLAILYYYGERGVKQNYNKSYEMFYEIASRKFEDAYPFVGMHYFYGRGIKQNYDAAKKWFELNEDYVTSSVHLGIMYEKGIVYERNIDMAVRYMNPCVEANEYAKRFMNSVRRKDGHWVMLE